MSNNPFLSLAYATEMENLGDDYYDIVRAAEFPRLQLRFRNNELLPVLGLQPHEVDDSHFLEAFGLFQGIRPFLALRYHGYQFGEYNPYLGDGRGFLYGQIRGIDGELYDLGTKGSGRTPHSRTADGRLTLKGGVREVLAAEALYRLGVNTSRCFSLIETGESLWRGDEPSPTRSSVMVRFSRSHVRFGTFERLYYLQRADLVAQLLNSVIAIYYPDIEDNGDKYIKFYDALVARVALLVAQWMAAGFCHGVLNTDNMSIAGESFDYGPYAFIPKYDLDFTAAYFDYGGRYCYGNQPSICHLNLELLQLPLGTIVAKTDLEAGLAKFERHYHRNYQKLMLKKLGFVNVFDDEYLDLLGATISFLKNNPIGYHDFFARLADEFNYGWRDDANLILENAPFRNILPENWRNLYHLCLQKLPIEKMQEIGDLLQETNPKTALLRPAIEFVWDAIANEDNWQPFYDLLKTIECKK
jgi:serine/tyrosine/threonine adenylyltransferase